MNRKEPDRGIRGRMWLRLSGMSATAVTVMVLGAWKSGLYRYAIDQFGTQRAHVVSAPVASAAFGWAAAAPASAPQVLYRSAVSSPGISSSVRNTSGRLVLTGTMIGTNPAESVAFIGIDAHHPQTYTTGGRLVNGLRLVGIFQKYVVLQKGETRTRLYLDGTLEAALPQWNGWMLMVGGLGSHPAAKASADEVFTDFIRPTPIYDGTAITGFQVYPGRQAAIFIRMGLRPGDVITSMDGQPLTDPTEAADMFRGLVSGGQANAQVLRGGKTVEITLDGSLIASELEREREQKYLSPPTMPPGA